MSNFSIPSELNILDLAVCLTLFISGVSGYRLGLLQSLFKAAGYIIGGLLGIYLALNYLEQFESRSIKLALTLILILLSAISLEYILAKVGVLIHKGLLFAPFKSIDLLAGSLLSVVKTSITYYIISTLLLATSWQIADDYIKDSKFYTTCDKYLPKVITDIKIEAKRIINL